MGQRALGRRGPVEAVRSLKSDSPSGLRTIGSLTLCRSLLEAEFVDRFRVVLFPVITGSTGRERIYDGYPDVDLENGCQPQIRRQAATARVRAHSPHPSTKQRSPRYVKRRTTSQAAWHRGDQRLSYLSAAWSGACGEVVDRGGKTRSLPVGSFVR